MIDKLNLRALEEYLELYPWYSAGYLELYKRLGNTAVSGELLSKAAPRLFSRQPLYKLYVERNGSSNIPATTEIENNVSGEILEIGAEQSDTKIITIGGDYFSRKDFENITLDRNQMLDKFIEDKPSLLRSALDNKNREYNNTKSENDGFDTVFNDSEFYTETLASVYVEQGYYKRALEIYAKLILLYPEKNSYFAALVKDLKSKHNL